MSALSAEWAELRRIARRFGPSPRRLARTALETLSLVVFVGGVGAAALALDPREGFQLPPEGLGGAVAVAEGREGYRLAPMGLAGREGRAGGAVPAEEVRSERYRAGSPGALLTAEAKSGTAGVPDGREGSAPAPGGARGASVAEVQP